MFEDTLEFKADQWCVDVGANTRAVLHCTLEFIEQNGLREKYVEFLEFQKRMCLKLHPKERKKK